MLIECNQNHLVFNFKIRKKAVAAGQRVRVEFSVLLIVLTTIVTSINVHSNQIMSFSVSVTSARNR
jgi:hypothetical protein